MIKSVFNLHWWSVAHFPALERGVPMNDPLFDESARPTDATGEEHASPATPTGTNNPTQGERKDFSSVELTPDILEWARRQFSDEEYAAGFRDIRENGGLELSDFIHELEQTASPDERPVTP